MKQEMKCKRPSTKDTKMPMHMTTMELDMKKEVMVEETKQSLLD